MSVNSRDLYTRSGSYGYSMGKQNTGRMKWGGGVRREYGGGLGAAGGENPFGADGSRGGSSGEPVLLDKAVAMERARAETQTNIDNANAGARARAAEMGLDYTPDQTNLIGAAGAMAANANQAGFGVDQQNNSTINEFAMQDKRDAFAEKMQSQSISANQNDPLRWAEFNQRNNQYRDAQIRDDYNSQGFQSGLQQSGAPADPRIAASQREQRARSAATAAQNAAATRREASNNYYV